MPSDYKKIREDNIRRRGEEFDDIGRLISEQLYSDPTHFVFELLQNAEDALSRRFQNDPQSSLPCGVRILLFEDRLEFRHFGQPFDIDDVRAITDVLRGTKTEDQTKIGKFGIGFKSVYAFTSLPQIHSGDEDFGIERYIRPYAIERPPSVLPRETVFVLPFNHEKRSPEDAHRLISRKLSNLDSRALLFLNCIDEIEWCIEETQEKGQYLKESVKRDFARQITLIGESNNQSKEESWLIFERPVRIFDTNHQVRVEIGFKLELSASDQMGRIVRTKDSPLVVFFPTERQTKLGFLVQGPYRTTPSRENILYGDSWNMTLVKETAILLVTALQHLKEMGLLSVSALETLPLKPIEFTKYDPLFPFIETVHTALTEQDLLPADDGTFVSARNARLASSDNLRKLLNHDQLRSLLKTNSEIKWLSGEITERNTRDLYVFLKKELEIDEIDPNILARRLLPDFLNAMDDAWFASFYEFLLDPEAIWRAPRDPSDSPGILRSKAILRLEDDKLVCPFDILGYPQAFLPSANKARFPTVKSTITAHPRALEFLKRLGLTEPDVTAIVIKNILPKYSSVSVGQINDLEYRADLQTIFGALSADSTQSKDSIIREARQTLFIKATNAATGELAFKRPTDTYLATRELQLFFAGNPDGWFVDNVVANIDLDALHAVGIRDKIPLHQKTPSVDGYVVTWHRHGYHERGIDGFDPDARIEGLKYALANPQFERSHLVWSILVDHVELLVGYVERASKKDFSNKTVLKRRSILGEDVFNNSWVPTKNMQFKRPDEILREELHPGLEPYEKLLTVLGIPNSGVSVQQETESIQARFARELGVKEEDLDVIKTVILHHPEILTEIKRKLESPGDVFPEKTSSDSARRQARVQEQYADAPEKEYVRRNRSIRTTRPGIDPKIWLKNLYTNNNNDLICQICKVKMPFRKRDGEFYFEAVEAFSQDERLHKEYEAQFLALCPVCSAMYKEYVKDDEDAVRSLIKTLEAASIPEVPIRLDGRVTSVRFVEIHFQDLKTILRQQLSSGSQGDSLPCTEEHQ